MSRFSVTSSTLKGIRRLSTTFGRNIRASFAMSPSECSHILPMPMLKIYREIHDWARQASSSIGQTWVIPPQFDGEEFAFMMNISLNAHQGGKWQVVFSVTSNCIFVRRYRAGEFQRSSQIIPELKVVGVPKIIEQTILL